MYEGKSIKKRIERTKISAFVWFGLLCSLGYGCYGCGFGESGFDDGRGSAKEFREEEPWFLLWISGRKTGTRRTKRRTSQICKKELDIPVPYRIDGTLENGVDSESDRLFFEFEFENLKDKVVCSFTVVFFVLDENGEPPPEGRNFVVLTIGECVDCGSSLKGRVDISDWVGFCSENSYETDFLFVSKITYDDGSVWIDETGLFC